MSDAWERLYDEKARLVAENDALKLRIAVLEKALSEASERAAVTLPAEAVLSLLSDWTHQYGAALCPHGRPDTYGEGMRAAKQQVAAILARANLAPDGDHE